MLTFSRLGKSLQQGDAEAEHLIAGDVACDCCISAEAEMVLPVFPWGAAAGEPSPPAAFCSAAHVFLRGSAGGTAWLRQAAGQ